jgi:hypothetical protein
MSTLDKQLTRDEAYTMKEFECCYDFQFKSLADVKHILQQQKIDYALLKVLPKNANDKNQVYVASDFKVLHPTFSMTFQERGQSTSLTKSKSSAGKRIPEAIFDDFKWLRNDGELVEAKNVKAIIYAQYPEARLSGFQAVDKSMPRALSVEYTKQKEVPPRLLILGKTPTGGAVGIFCTFPTDSLINEVKALEGVYGSKVTKKLQLESSRTTKLEAILSDVVKHKHDGCRFDKHGVKIPFNGTQVCGYTLEHACGIIPNSNKDGDIFGIELKTHTKPKVTLFTPEPDFGCYAENFNNFMTTYGYQDDKGNWRLTGLHRANIKCEKSGLTLTVRTSTYDDTSKEVVYLDFNPDKSLTSQMDSIEVVLLDDNGIVAAGWSLERLMNCWGSKHNEVVYVAASKTIHSNASKVEEGYKYEVSFDNTVMWCHETSADHLFKAIHNGTIFLDPAPKYCPDNLKDNKRRSQWRVNNVRKASLELYEKTRDISL